METVHLLDATQQTTIRASSIGSGNFDASTRTVEVVEESFEGYEGQSGAEQVNGTEEQFRSLDKCDRTAVSVESIGKIGGNFLLSPIPQSGEGNNSLLQQTESERSNVGTGALASLNISPNLTVTGDLVNAGSDGEKTQANVPTSTATEAPDKSSKLLGEDKHVQIENDRQTEKPGVLLSPRGTCWKPVTSRLSFDGFGEEFEGEPAEANHESNMKAVAFENADDHVSGTMATEGTEREKVAERPSLSSSSKELCARRSDDVLYASNLQSTLKNSKSFETPRNEEISSEQQRLELNESATSAASQREDEITKTKEELGATSLAFIQRLRGAAFRRKMNLARSRDSLAAKERKQLEDIAASKAARARMSEETARPSTSTVSERRKTISTWTATKDSFKARPVPSTTGVQGSGGLSGVPKVPKKPTTTPLSPLLGARRQQRTDGQGADPESVARPASTTAPSENAFRARPLPRTTGKVGGAGQSGVPKVPKRPTTVPRSPLLGFRRIQTEESRRIDPQLQGSRTNRRSKQPTNSRKASGASQTSLLGLGSVNQQGKENYQEPATPVHKTTHFPQEYRPHSTVRAKKRAEFEARRIQNERVQVEKESRRRRESINSLRKELNSLRQGL
jgi:hypothetical protein